ncbi:ABC-type Na+ efflux pump permease subunit [Methanocalculus alkaliphilus]|uniref:PrsW family intramembrane metalloprotease n=1 Tax=Methanocalculus alkaliphilus TaxID=768730 RepID=UPI00344C705A|nr:ABC-type Na+ efflux pump permease subunit [Methanocalculus alkaliphilus]
MRMHILRQISVISRWELRRTLSTMGRGVLPAAIILFILLILASGFAASSGVHLQDGIYRLGTDNREAGEMIAADTRFTIYLDGGGALWENRQFYDIIILGSEVYVRDDEKGRAALGALSQVYERYTALINAGEPDLYAAYPLWIDRQYERSLLDFTATEAGRRVSPVPEERPPAPQQPIVPVATPDVQIPYDPEQLRAEISRSAVQDDQIRRYAQTFGVESGTGTFRTPAQLAPPLPFDSIILIFVFIFPLYFTSQFFMMSIMNERIERRGEILLSTPSHPSAIILGKALPYFLLMVAISGVIILISGLPPIVILPLIPVILFFLAAALVIGMLARSFKELSFLSIFFSTVATSYLFFPSIFANVHVIALISPLTLIVLEIQGDAFTLTEYIYSTALFYLTSAILLYAGVVNFNEERLFSFRSLIPRTMEFISAGISTKYTLLSLFSLGALVIPFVFMVQMMGLVFVFNLPMPLSLLLLLGFAAATEEIAKSIGIYALAKILPGGLSWRHVIFGSGATALGFLAGEKLLLFATIAQVTESVFGSILFLSLELLWMPFLLHAVCLGIVAVALKAGGLRMYIPALCCATVVHVIYNLAVIGVIP